MLALIPLFPLVGFLINAALGRRLPKGVSGGLASLVMIASFVVSAIQSVRFPRRVPRQPRSGSD